MATPAKQSIQGGEKASFEEADFLYKYSFLFIHFWCSNFHAASLAFVGLEQTFQCGTYGDDWMPTQFHISLSHSAFQLQCRFIAFGVFH
ncbi:hypothetical protein SLA2020_223270 [Shorea laevis]